MRQAQELVTDETPIEQVNQARYYLCTVYYYQEDYASAAVLADFLASRFPASEEGRRAAAVSLASLVRLYGDGSAPWASSLYERMTQTAQRIARQWKGQPEADDALVTLVTIAIQQGNIDAALQNLAQVSQDSTRRAAAELATGQALWTLANQGISHDGDVTLPAQRQQQAIDLMRQGLQRSAGQAPTASTLTASLIVAQHLLNQGQASDAVAVLENEQLGPKALADQNSPLVGSADLRQRVYMISIMAYLGALSDSDSATTLIDKALTTLEQIKDTAAGDAASQRQLASTYVLLARNLQQQIETAPASRQAALVAAFSQLLDRAADSTRELSVLNWVAESYVNLGNAVEAIKAGDPALAKSYYAKAVATYESILKHSDAGEYTMTARERLLLETRLAIALREQQEFAEAMNRFAAVLQREPTQVYVQMEAARTLQRWGDQGNHKAYQLAIVGDRPDSQTQRNTIWGYGRIAKLIASKPALSDLFYEARYGVAECRFQYALQLAAAERTDALKQAEQDIVMTARLYPQLGSEQSREKYHRLLQQIQQSLGKRPTGLSS